MRNLLALLGAALVAFLGLGWYLDWYHVTPKTSPTAGHRSLEIDVNAKKIGEDVERGVKTGSEKLHGLIDGDKKPAPPAAAAQVPPYSPPR
jgi:hypothetical protein